MTDRFNDRVVIVTGGSAGIGLATAEALASEGAMVALVGRSAERLAKAYDAVLARSPAGGGSGRVAAFALDVRSERDMEQMARWTIERFGRINALVHCAGLLRPPDRGLARFTRLDTADWDTVVDTNLRGTFLSNRAVLADMLDRAEGDIVNLSSISGRRAMAFDAPYAASKFGVLGLTEAIAAEVRQEGVRVQALLPGIFDTAVLDQLGQIPRPPVLPPASRVAEVILAMLALPRDCFLWPPVVQATAGDIDQGMLARGRRRGTPQPVGSLWPGGQGISLASTLLR